MNNQREKTVLLNAWKTQLADAQKKPWLASLLMRNGDTIFARFRFQYERLRQLPRNTRRVLMRRAGMTLGSLALALALSSNPIQAQSRATITVDGVTCTLAEAITSANANSAGGNGCVDGSGDDVIVLSADATLASALPDVTSDITINGNGYAIDGGNSVRVLTVSSASGDLTLNNVTVRNGSAGVMVGGGVYVQSGALTVNESTVSGNSARRGGGIYSRNADVTIHRSTISGNSATEVGGGLLSYNSTGNFNTMTLNNSTVSGNSASDGGGVAGAYGFVTLNSSTITQNSATSYGGGFYAPYANFLTMGNSIVSGNTAGFDGNDIHSGGLYANNGGNVIGSNAAASFENIYGFAAGATDVDASSDYANVPIGSILNTTLANNGGSTLTHALVNGSPAVDRSAIGPATDQIGTARPSGTAYDSGAVEYISTQEASINGSQCTLANAIIAANTDAAAGSCNAGNAGADTITLLNDITLTAALPQITTPIVLEGAQKVLDGANAYQVLYVSGSSGDLTVNDITIQNGLKTDGGGGGIYNTGTLTVNDSTIKDSVSAGSGGAIFNAGTATINQSTISGNSATYGGGIGTVDTLVIDNSTISGNSAIGGYAPPFPPYFPGGAFPGNGGGIANNGGLTITNSTVTGNKAGYMGDTTGDAAGIDSQGSLTIANSIVAGNLATAPGIEIRAAGTVDNQGGNVFGTSVATSAQNVLGLTIASVDYDASSDANNRAINEILSVALADNGGPTLTHLLPAGSPAIDLVPNSSRAVCTTDEDQRDAPRPGNGIGSQCDAGAVERQVPTAIELEAFSAEVNLDGSVTVNWMTAQEIDHAGFNLYRRNVNSRDDWQQVNGLLIGSQGSQALGAEYEFIDTDASVGTWEYMLEDIETDGDRYRHQDMSATVEVATPTAVQLFGQSSSPQSLFAVMMQFIVMLLATAGVIRLNNREEA